MGLTITDVDDPFVHKPGCGRPAMPADDPRWFERFWLNVHSPEGGPFLGCGIGTYPNLGVTDGFALLTDGKRQMNVRASTRALQEPTRPTVGPLQAECLVPMKRWAFRLAPGHGPFSFEFEFTAAFPPVAHVLPHAPEPRPALPVEWWTFVQTADVKGVIRREGSIIDLKPGRYRAGRDRSWGIRPGIGGPGEIEWLQVFQTLGWGFLLYWVLARFDRRQVWYFGTHDPGGGNRHFVGSVLEKGRVTAITDVEHEVELDPASGRLRSTRVRLHVEGGHPIDLKVSPIATVYLRGGLYDGLNGVHHGTDRGDLVVETETWDVTSDETRQTVTGLNDHVSKFEGPDGVGYGVFELHYGT